MSFAKMNRKRALLLTAVLVSIGCVIFLVLSTGKPKPHPAHLSLRIVSQEEPKEAVVFFRVEGADAERIFISSVHISPANRRFGEADRRIKVGRVLDSSGLWHTLPLRDPNMSRRDFGVNSPTNFEAWNLVVVVRVEESASERINSLWTSFISTLEAGADFGIAFQFAWNQPRGGYASLKSELVINRN